MVANLDSYNPSRDEIAYLCIETARVFFNVPKSPCNAAVRVENRRILALTRDRRLPCQQQWVIIFHHLQKPPGANRFRAPFRR